jgi:hypothetical protein
MLRTLKDYPINDYRGIVASAASAMFPDPYSGEIELPKSGQTRSVIEEAADRLGIDLVVLNDKDVKRLVSLLNDELRKTVFNERQKNLTLEELANRGMLDTAQFQIKNSKLLRDQAKKLGLSVSELLDAVEHPTSYQHLSADSDMLEGAKLFSLFVKFIPDACEDEVIWDLVFAMREKRTMTALSGWRIYRSELAEEFDVDGATPLDLLMAFVERYGLPVSVSGMTERKFILYKRIPVGEGEDPKKILRIQAPEGIDFEQHMLVRVNDSPRSIDVSVAFMIDVTSYKESLDRHQSRPARSLESNMR